MKLFFRTVTIVLASLIMLAVTAYAGSISSSGGRSTTTTLPRRSYSGAASTPKSSDGLDAAYSNSGSTSRRAFDNYKAANPDRNSPPRPSYSSPAPTSKSSGGWDPAYSNSGSTSRRTFDNYKATNPDWNSSSPKPATRSGTSTGPSGSPRAVSRDAWQSTNPAPAYIPPRNSPKVPPAPSPRLDPAHINTLVNLWVFTSIFGDSASPKPVVINNNQGSTPAPPTNSSIGSASAASPLPSTPESQNTKKPPEPGPLFWLMVGVGVVFFWRWLRKPLPKNEGELSPEKENPDSVPGKVKPKVGSILDAKADDSFTPGRRISIDSPPLILANSNGARISAEEVDFTIEMVGMIDLNGVQIARAYGRDGTIMVERDQRGNYRFFVLDAHDVLTDEKDFEAYLGRWKRNGKMLATGHLCEPKIIIDDAFEYTRIDGTRAVLQPVDYVERRGDEALSAYATLFVRHVQKTKEYLLITIMKEAHKAAVDQWIGIDIPGDRIRIA